MKKNNFEESIIKIEEIITKLDNNNIELDEAIKLFEEGTQLCKNCDEEIKRAELVIKKFNAEQVNNDK